MDSSSPSDAAAGRVLHLAEAEAWRRGQQCGAYTGSTRGADLADVGYVHMSTAAQLPAVIAFLYADVAPDELVLLVVDLATLAAAGVEVRWEALEGAGSAFPHAYGAVPVAAVVAALDLATDDAGRLALPDLAGLHVLGSVDGPAGA